MISFGGNFQQLLELASFTVTLFEVNIGDQKGKEGGGFLSWGEKNRKKKTVFPWDLDGRGVEEMSDFFFVESGDHTSARVVEVTIKKGEIRETMVENSAGMLKEMGLLKHQNVALF